VVTNGFADFVAGTVTVSNTVFTTNSAIVIQYVSLNTNVSPFSVVQSNGWFTVNSASSSDTNRIKWGIGSVVPQLVSSNMTYASLTWAGPTNTLALANSYSLYTATTNFNITNVSGGVSGQANWQVLTVSNSTAGYITGYVSVASARAIGSASTNALGLAAGKLGVFSVMHLNNQVIEYRNSSER